MVRRFVGVLVLGVVGAVWWFVVADRAAAYEKAAPYSRIEWEDGQLRPRVWIDERWYGLESIDGVSVEDLVAFARETYRGRWQKRFDEDLVELMTTMGHPPGASVRLGLLDRRDGRSFVRDGVPMTSGNRRSIMAHKYGGARAEGPADARRLAAADIAADLDAFRRLLDERFAYRHVHAVDLDAQLDGIRARAADGMDRSVFALELEKVLALFIDGHARIEGVEAPRGSLPFLIRPAGERFVAFRPERDRLLDAEHPYVVALDGKPMEAWIQALSPNIPRGSAPYVRHQGLRRLRDLALARDLAGVDASEAVEVTLVSADGDDTVTRTLPLAGRRPTYGTWPRRESALLESDIGYLRLPAMDDGAVDEVRTWMPRFQDTRGLIIDVRGNGGGSRAALLELFPYLMTAEDEPHVANVARYRLHPDFDEDHLEARAMYPADAPHWSDAERAAIAAFMKTFRPEWTPPEGAFSPWHVLVLSKREDDSRPHYEGPVVVLMDDRCFSATDIFLGALAGRRDVVLMGSASGGGSARSVPFRLPRSGLQGRLASMASFRPTGALYDGRGIVPDVDVPAAPTFFLRGGTDPVLERAIREIQGR